MNITFFRFEREKKIMNDRDKKFLLNIFDNPRVSICAVGLRMVEVK
jgi:hypothetical protein